jgi:hypothetical protein
MKIDKKIDLIFGSIFITLIIVLFGLAFRIGQLSEQIEQSNKILFIWEGLEKDIPKDGELIQISRTDENVIYLNPVDE